MNNKQENNISIKKINHKFVVMEGDIPYKFRDDALIKNQFDSIEEAESIVKAIHTQKEIFADVERIFGDNQ